MRGALSPLKRRRRRGLSVPDLGAEMTALATSQQALSASEIAELDRRFAAIEAGEVTVSNDIVVQWPRTWGTPAAQIMA